MTASKLYLPNDLLLQLEQLSLVAKRRIRGTMQGKRRSKQLGSSLEFADYREYTPGDDTRRFDWGVYGRTGKPFIKQYMDEQELQVHLFIDASPSMNFGGELSGTLVEGGKVGNKLDYAKQLAACIGYIALSSYDRVDAACFADRIINHTPLLRGKGSAARLFQFMESAEGLAVDKQGTKQGSKNGNIQGNSQADSYFARPFMNPYALSRQQGMTFIFSDFLAEQGVEEALSYMIAARQEVVVVQVLHQQELEPSLIGDLKLIDSEQSGGKEVAVSGRVLRAYQDVVQTYTDGLRQYCHERGMTYVMARTDLPVSEMVLKLLRQTGVLI